MDASIVICSRDRAASLRRTLESLTGLAIRPELQWEVVVVDNDSSDHTPDVLAGFAGRLPLVAAHEPRPGLSHARNRGVRVATGRYLVWTDDDVCVDRQWLAAYAEAFRQWPEAVLFGGKVLPVLEEPSPAWFRAAQGAFAELLAYRDFGDAPMPLSWVGKRMPYGANFAIRAAEQRRLAYDPRLGLAPGRTLLGEEAEMFRAVLAGGATGYWVPGAIVQHRIPPQRQTVAYVKRYYTASGETDALLTGPDRRGGLLGVPKWLWRRVPELYLRYWCARIFAGPRRWGGLLAELCRARGALLFHLRRYATTPRWAPGPSVS